MPTTVSITDPPYNCPTDETSNCRPAFLAMRDDFQGEDVILDCPPNRLVFTDDIIAYDDQSYLFRGLNSIIIRADSGCIFEGTFHFGAVVGTTGENARMQTVSNGATFIPFIDSEDASKFSANTYAMMGGFDQQGIWLGDGYGEPTNLAFNEWVYITSVSSSGVTISEPLLYSYKSTWPLYDDGGSLGQDKGGPATLFAMDPNWDMSVDLRGPTIERNPDLPTYAKCREIIYRDLTFTGIYGPTPTQTKLWKCINVDASGALCEVDKLIGEMVTENCQWSTFEFQSAGSVRLWRDYGSTILTSILGTPTRAVLVGTQVQGATAGFRPAAWVAGVSDEVIAIGCDFANFSEHGIIDRGVDDAGVQNCYSMADGLITIPNDRGVPFTMGAVSWAVPGAKFMWRGQYTCCRMATVLDVTQDATNTYVHTDWGRGFPDIPLAGGTVLAIVAMTIPKLTMRDCTGTSVVEDLSGVEPGRPIYEQTIVDYDKTDTPSATDVSWRGDLNFIRVNVTAAHGSALTATLQFRFMQDDDSISTYTAVVDLDRTGQRELTSGGATNTGGSDSFPALPDGIWSVEGYHMNCSLDVSGTASPVAWTVHCDADQGFAPNTAMFCNFD